MKREYFTSTQIKEISKRVKLCRSAKNYSQRTLASILNIKKDVIRRLESAEIKSIDVELLHRIANCLQCNVDYLLLKNHVYRSSDPKTHYLAYPTNQKNADSFVYTHGQFRADIEYMAEYMHEDYQKEILDLIHTMVTFHKIAVKFPNTTPIDAKMLSFAEAFQTIKQNFFDRPNPNKGIIHRIPMRKIPKPTKFVFKTTSTSKHKIIDRRWVKLPTNN